MASLALAAVDCSCLLMSANAPYFVLSALISPILGWAANDSSQAEMGVCDVIGYGGLVVLGVVKDGGGGDVDVENSTHFLPPNPMSCGYERLLIAERAICKQSIGKILAVTAT